MDRELDDRQIKLLTVFRRAIRTEQEAQEVYTGAAAICGDPEIKALLESFAREEAHHEQELLKLYQRLRTRGSFQDAA